MDIARPPLDCDAEITSLLNTLLETERAGARVVSACLGDLALPPGVRARRLVVQSDECRNSAVLVRMLRHVGAEPSNAVGEFLQMALTVQGSARRLEFLNRGQAWVARRIAAALPRIADAAIHAEMRAMHDSHLRNIEACRGMLEELAEPWLPRS